MYKVRPQCIINLTILINSTVFDDKRQPNGVTLRKRHISEVFKPRPDPLAPDVVMNCLDLPQDGPRIKIPRQE